MRKDYHGRQRDQASKVHEVQRAVGATARRDFGSRDAARLAGCCSLCIIYCHLQRADARDNTTLGAARETQMGRRLDSPDGANAGVSFLLPGGELGIRLAAGADGREPHNYSKSGRAERVVPRAKKRVRIGASAAKQGFGEIGIKQTWTHGEDAKQTVLPDGGRA
ncbi:hypothetical protein KL929_002417 [Ogataea haglerorum]|nr:hypothetical protein KL929_002417 [Ogataea haglerorum]